MKVSLSWLQEYFEKPLPNADELADLLTFHAFEIEGVEKVGDDHVIDIDVLPNRSSDCMSHIGVAREIATLLDVDLKYDPFNEDIKEYGVSKEFAAEVEDSNLCPRFALSVVEGVKIGPSPDWLKEKLEVLGQRSINNVVDATNYVMLNLGQPLHAYDAEKLKGGDHKKIVVRNAKKGEKVTTLTGDEYEVDESVLLIAGGVSGKPLGLAGVKGGKEAEVDEKTVDVVLEAGHFDPGTTRKTSQKLKLWTDASTRFQNNPSSDLIPFALQDVTELIMNIAGGTVEGAIDIDTAKNENPVVSVSVKQINSLLGTALTKEDVESILKRLTFSFTEEGDVFSVTSPFYRKDINIYEDLIEEVGRVYGYKHIEAKQLPDIDIKPTVHKEFYFADRVRNILSEAGFSEVYGYTFQEKGEYEAIHSLASDKAFLRTSLKDELTDILEKNHKNAPLFGLERVKIFEIGRVFPKTGETLHLAVGVSGKKADKFVEEVKSVLEEKLEISISENIQNGILEIDLLKLIDSLSVPDAYEPFEKSLTAYEPISLYPFVLRDLAVWIPQSSEESDILNIVQNHAGELLVKTTKFDEFAKDDRVSFAFHLVFQSKERTLTDDEIGEIMQKIESDLNKKDGFEVR